MKYNKGSPNRFFVHQTIVDVETGEIIFKKYFNKNDWRVIENIINYEKSIGRDGSITTIKRIETRVKRHVIFLKRRH